ncbi:MAG: peptide deformylase [Acidimicrobiaceae bacterium]|nr:peptide deformylase [Acidimicrobiaceae bacterium]MDQ1367943.1 peptide deformylase [Acidimicrobiaceae bacterium]MDQ1413790.1 peptide deformylase [Acidimicrobiaceae bacterium]MDQ1414734.1 peptide deformylase [Acidimicrobiaceae bacterium]MDQ1418534.1 peptide deformylase [Acidimicrobiaceae bacterium]
MTILQVGAAVLRRRADHVDPDKLTSPKLGELIEVLRAGLVETPGVGLAAPQIGVSLRVALIQDPPQFHARVSEDRLAELERTAVEPYILINPEIEPVGDERRTFFEGCLSVDGYCALVERAKTVRVRWLDPSGDYHEALQSGWHARILQHEIDHLNGILYVDRMLPRSFMTTLNYADWVDEPLDKVRAVFGV